MSAPAMATTTTGTARRGQRVGTGELIAMGFDRVLDERELLIGGPMWLCWELIATAPLRCVAGWPIRNAGTATRRGFALAPGCWRSCRRR